MADIDFDHLRNNPIWRKKLTKFVEFTDTDKDGYVSRADYDLMVTRYKDLPLTDPSHAEVMAKVNETWITLIGLKGSKKMSYEEFVEQFMIMAKKLLADEMDNQLFGSVFDTIDTNGDGFIDLAEWRVHYECHGTPVKYAKASFNAIDTNHDGLLSREEFLSYHHEYFFTSESSLLCGPLD